ncbi:hypothetical protein C0Q70_01972 [Pomacea canaliculata]|uniref:Serine/threonine-protein kinase 19 n=2 Tax=Pomacea canaliculata TaxID=400727 RepID=A0A2T7Q0Z4_POMCA|nr:serine/threonine-protein kinase 19-like isoform X2 [Pomacea canaliculata]XP_025093719.1 serine/threonine-protein kinase 19-like isoform X2 [Pomacea canaliculata]PVD39342.1 hypothetical protein C0Q70_01972 [Pomacea canaliculata]
MSRKRTLLPDLYKAKRQYVPSSANNEENGMPSTRGDTNGLSEVPSDTKAALLLLRGLFPLEKFEERLPPIILKHQLYSLVKNRTLVDKQLNDLVTAGEVKVFKLGVDSNSQCLVFSADYTHHVLRVMSETKVDQTLIEKVRVNILDAHTDISLEKDSLTREYGFTDAEITQLVQVSLLTVRDVGSWWLSIPNTGIFMKSYIRGRKSLLTMIKKCKYREILKTELEQRRWPKLARLGISYHIHDIIGADLVDCIMTTSGELLRLRE